ncbi:hypothetical protein ACFORG_01075 [Lutimaribacter marinistellae]|uniref:Transmembrane protein n=1 Tax=Lutimaribacter marinistellae TaxID=1820329 RepID=A0ABV7TE79_9RHOB
MVQFSTLIAPLLTLVALSGGAVWTGATSALGAAPWWAEKVVWAGLPAGIALAATAWLLAPSRRPRLLTLAALTVIAFTLARYGQANAVASAPEAPELAAQTWYFGWFATCALATATVASLFRYHRPAH